jgi:hypothetical protein
VLNAEMEHGVDFKHFNQCESKQCDNASPLLTDSSLPDCIAMHTLKGLSSERRLCENRSH